MAIFNMYSSPDDLKRSQKLIFYGGLIALFVIAKKGIDKIIKLQSNEQETQTNLQMFNKYLIMILLLLLPISQTKVYSENFKHTYLFVGLTIVGIGVLSLLNYFSPESVVYYDSETINNINDTNIVKFIITMILVIALLSFIIVKIVFKGHGIIPITFTVLINLLSFLYVHFSNNTQSTKFAYWLITYMYLLFLIPDNIETVIMFSILYAVTVFGMDVSNLSFFSGKEESS
jgi:hypothetical protein